MSLLYEKVLTRLLEALQKNEEAKLEEEEEIKEMSTVAGGSLGTGPTDMFSLPIGMVSNSHELNKKQNSKKSKKTNKSYINKSPQHYIKNGGEKKRKRSFK